MDRSGPVAQTLYRYRFDDAEFDAARVELRVAGARVELEQRPLQVLALLLRHVDEVVPRQQFFDQVWEGRPTVDNVLANAVAKLRKALGAAAGARLVNVPRVGYRMRGPVERAIAGRRAMAPFALEVGQPVPGRVHFRLVECLDPEATGSVWRVRHEKTGESRIYKFAPDAERLDALKREVTIHRVLRETLGERDDFVRLVDWNFEAPPCWLQSEDGGRDLARWAREDPSLANASSTQRIEWFLQIVDAVAAAHRAGVLHKDLKPCNVLVARKGEGWRLRVADFGSGRLLEPRRLQELGITRMGMTVSGAVPDRSGMTLLYLAPEVLAGGAPSLRSDVYALGLMLLQMLAGDMHRTLAPGWEQSIDDELLREDIAIATDGDPARRLPDASELGDRLRGLGARRRERKRLRESDARALEAERLLQRSRARRPWIAIAALLLLGGLGFGAAQLQRLRAARDEARHQAAVAQAMNRFLNEDVLGAGLGGNSPAWYERNPTLREILEASAEHVDRRFAGDPLLRAELHQTLGRAWRSTGAYARAADELRSAANLLRTTLAASDERNLLAQYEFAGALAHLSRFDEAKAALDRADAIAGKRRDGISELALRAHLARADVEYQRMRVRPALAEYRRAAALQRKLRPDDVPLAAHLQLAIAGCDLRLGRPRDAEAIARTILAGAPYTRESIGLAAIATARSRLGNALRGQRRYPEAIAATRQSLADYEHSEGADSQGAISALSALSYLYSLTGDGQGALRMQREVYERSLRRWGADSQYTLVELLNLGTDESDEGDLESALPHLRQAEAGLARVSGPHGPATQAARVVLASALSDRGEDAQALALIDRVDPAAYQATTSEPGRGLVLQAMRARILLRLGRESEGRRLLREALAGMRQAGVSAEEIASFREPEASTRAASANTTR
jgi:non-specific serine/threonine protein kinase